MKNYFVCSLFHNGILGGGMLVDENTITYRTGKVTVDTKYKNLVIDRTEILSLSWKWVLFPRATFKLKNGEEYSFFIFNKKRFVKVYGE